MNKVQEKLGGEGIYWGIAHILNKGGRYRTGPYCTGPQSVAAVE